MKLPLLVSVLSAALAPVISFAADAPPAAGDITLRVEQSNKVEQTKDRVTKTQTHTLKLYLINSSHEEVKVKIKFAYFAHGIKDHNIFVISEGEKEATVKPASTGEELTTPGKAIAVSATKKAPASGNTMVGYGVQVFQGDKLVAESYEPTSLKDEMGKAPPAKKDPKAAK